MIHTNPNPRYPQIRGVTAAIAALAIVAAASGIAGAGTVLTWAVAAIALTVFAATFYLKQ